MHYLRSIESVCDQDAETYILCALFVSHYTPAEVFASFEELLSMISSESRSDEDSSPSKIITMVGVEFQNVYTSSKRSGAIQVFVGYNNTSVKIFTIKPEYSLQFLDKIFTMLAYTKIEDYEGHNKH